MLNTHLPCESPASDYQRERKACIHTETCYADIYGSIIHISQRLETPTSGLTVEYIEMKHIHIVEYYFVIKTH